MRELKSENDIVNGHGEKKGKKKKVEIEIGIEIEFESSSRRHELKLKLKLKLKAVLVGRVFFRFKETRRESGVEGTEVRM